MPSENYRYYCLDDVGRLHDAEWFYAESDEDAIAAARQLQPDAIQCEIWKRNRLVATIKAGEEGAAGGVEGQGPD